ncbi:MAG: dihydroorotase [Burkholderiaceae bacterium]|jgi:dihydroorotase
MTTQLVIDRPDDWHVHFRDAEVLGDVVGATARQFGRALVMPNLKPPVVTAEMAVAYRSRILASLPQGLTFEPWMTLYLTDHTSPETVRAAKDSGVVLAFKLYPAGATTNSDSGVTDLRHCQAALAEMERLGVVLCLHGEVTGQHDDVFDREALFIDRILEPMRRDFPGLRLVFEHITTAEAADYVRQASGDIAATITPQHLLLNRNSLFQGGLRPHLYCLPVLKREHHREALLKVATSGNPRFFLGTDTAPHARHLKESDCGCAGCFSALTALEFYAGIFESQAALDRLEAFASHHGADFYGLPRSTQKVILRREPQVVPRRYRFGGDEVVPLLGGETIDWTFQGIVPSAA